MEAKHSPLSVRDGSVVMGKAWDKPAFHEDDSERPFSDEAAFRAAKSHSRRANKSCRLLLALNDGRGR
jgi:hypothetical protein